MSTEGKSDRQLETLRAAAAAQSVRCDGCGGAIPIQTLSATVSCPFCGHEQALDSSLLQELAGYQALSRTRAQQARFNVGRATIRDRDRPWMPIMLLMVLPLILAGLVALLLHWGLFGGGGRRSMVFVPTICLFGAFFVGLVGYLNWHFRDRAHAPAGRSSGSPMSCPHCGAINTFRPGQVLETCAHCGGTLMPNSGAMWAALDAAHESLRRAQMARARAERVGAEAPIIRVWFASLRRRRAQRWRGALDDLAGGLEGRSLSRLVQIVGWLNTFWAGPYDPAALYVGPLFRGVSCTVAGYPVLIFFDPVPRNAEASPKIDLFLAAWLLGLSDGREQPLAHSTETRRLAQKLREAGFRLEYNQAGLLARADSAIVSALLERPQGVPEELPTTVSTMAQLARGLGASAGRAIE